MAEHYNHFVATHYAAYRPPLHKMILGRVLSGNKTYPCGLDVGCGTGYSAIALARYCTHVYGIDPSRSMIDQATPHEKVTYLHNANKRIPLADSSVDVLTFAGSLFYAKSKALMGELKRVSRSKALVIIYDFEVMLDGVLSKLGMNFHKTQPNYDHTINFSNCADFSEVLTGRELASLEVTAAELAHILLSNLKNLEAFEKKYGVSDPFAQLAQEIEATGKKHLLQANIFFSSYHLNSVHPEMVDFGSWQG
jgi:ubiquinone/menaquinone biosynthesis C-methylase UbiE